MRTGCSVAVSEWRTPSRALSSARGKPATLRRKGGSCGCWHSSTATGRRRSSRRSRVARRSSSSDAVTRQSRSRRGRRSPGWRPCGVASSWLAFSTSNAGRSARSSESARCLRHCPTTPDRSSCWRATRKQPSGSFARTLGRTGQLDEAEEQTVVSERNASRDDLASQTTWRGVRARVHARRAEFEQAQQLAREAVAIADRTDFLVWHGEALLDLAEVNRLAGDSDSFVRAAIDALRLFDAKGHLVLSEQTRALLRQSAVAVRPLDGRLAVGIRSSPFQREERRMSTIEEQPEPPAQEAHEETGSIEPPRPPAEEADEESASIEPPQAPAEEADEESASTEPPQDL